MKSNNLVTILLIAVFLINPSGMQISCSSEDSPQEVNTDDKISLDLKNVDIGELLRIISLKTGKTIVPSKEVTGRITIYLSNVAFSDVLDIILVTQGLALNHAGNIYYVMSEAEYRKNFGRDYVDQRKIQTVKLVYAKPSIIFNALSQLKSDVGKIVVDEATGTIILIDTPEKLELLNKTIKDLDRPLTTAIYDLNYIKAADAKAQFGAAITPGTGEVIIDERSGKAIISDLPQKMQKMNMLVRELDEDSRQVYIEVEIVEIALNDKFERGIDWEKVWSSAAMDGLTLAGYFPAAALIAKEAINQKIAVGTLATDHYKAIFNFLGTYGNTTTISQPRIAVVNNEEASLMVGTREAYITATSSQATSSTLTSENVEFIDVGVKLKIVPKIGADGFITMKLKPEVSSVKDVLTTDAGTQVPIVQTSQSETTVKVKDGTMIMIAGMTKLEDIEDISGWPVLSKIPFLGTFFSYRSNEKKRTEIIIFLTPHLSTGDVSLRGDEITKIVPMEHLSENLKDKVGRDKAIDKNLYTPEKVQDELEKKKAIEMVAQEAAERKAASAAGKDAAKAAKVAAEQARKAANKSIEKAAKIEIEAQEKAARNQEKAIKAAKEKAVKEAEKPPEQESAKDYYQRGLRAQADANPKEAIFNFTKATEIDKQYAAAYNILGVLYEQESKLDKAENMYLKAIEVDPHFCAAYSNLALFNEERADFTKALEYWRKRVLYGNPEDPWTIKALKRIKELEN